MKADKALLIASAIGWNKLLSDYERWKKRRKKGGQAK